MKSLAQIYETYSIGSQYWIIYKLCLQEDGTQQPNSSKSSQHKYAAKLLQSCPTPCDPIDGSPPGSPVPGILQARTLEWVAISSSNAWKWSRSVMSDPHRPHGLQPTRLLRSWDFPGKSTFHVFCFASTGVGCHCVLCNINISYLYWCVLLKYDGHSLLTI